MIGGHQTGPQALAKSISTSSKQKASAHHQSSRHQVKSRIILVWLSSLPAAAHHHLHPCNVATMGQPSTALVPPAAANAALSPTTAAAAHTQLLAYLPPARSCCCCRAWQHHAAHIRAKHAPTGRSRCCRAAAPGTPAAHVLACAAPATHCMACSMHQLASSLHGRLT